MRVGLVGKRREESRVRIPGGGQLIVRGELLDAVFADRLEHPVTRHAAIGEDEERAVDQRCQDVEHLIGAEAVAGTDRRGTLRGDPRREYGHPPGDQPLVFAQEIPAPVDDGAQRLLAGQRGAAASRKQPEAVVEARGDLGNGQRAQPRSRELDRERQAVEAPADLDDAAHVRCVDRESRRSGGRAIREELGGGVLARNVRVGVGGRHAEGRDHHQLLAGDAERLPAGRDDPKPRTVREQLVGEHRRRGDDVLAVVEDEDRLALGEDVEQVGHGVGVGRRCRGGGSRARSAGARSPRAGRARSGRPC